MKMLSIFLIILTFFTTVEARPVRVAIPGFASLIPLTIAQEKGYYRQEGLQVELVLMGAVVGIQSLISGEVDFAGATVPGLNAALRGAPLRVVFATVYRPLFWLVGKRDLRDINALKGKRIGINALGGGDDFVLRDFLKKFGLQGGRDVTILSLGTAANRFAGLMSGSVDAALLQTPFNIRAEEAGFRELGDLTKENVVDLGGGMVTSEARIKSDPAVVQKFMRATVKGLIHARDDRSAADFVLARDLKVNASLAAKAYDQMRPSFTTYGAVSEQMQRAAVEFLLRLQGKAEPSQLAPERFFDFSFVHKAHAELQAQGWKAGR